MAKEWPLTLYTLLSFVSTVATFYKPILSGHVRLFLALSSVATFVAATIRVDLKRQKRIGELEEQIARQLREKRRAELVIYPGTRSKYVAVRARDQYPLPLKGLHVELDFSVENKGDRVSSINRYTLTLPDFAKSYPDIKPYFTQMVKGRYSTMRSTRSNSTRPVSSLESQQNLLRDLHC